MTRVSVVLLSALFLLAACAGPEIDLRRAAADITRSACRGTGNCTVTCGDGSTLDGRPSHARCRN